MMAEGGEGDGFLLGRRKASCPGPLALSGIQLDVPHLSARSPAGTGPASIRESIIEVPCGRFHVACSGCVCRRRGDDAASSVFFSLPSSDRPPMTVAIHCVVAQTTDCDPERGHGFGHGTGLPWKVPEDMSYFECLSSFGWQDNMRTRRQSTDCASMEPAWHAETGLNELACSSLRCMITPVADIDADSDSQCECGRGCSGIHRKLSAVVMGRFTLESSVGAGYPGRVNVCVSKQLFDQVTVILGDCVRMNDTGQYVVRTLDDALVFCQEHKCVANDSIYVIGGRALVEETLHHPRLASVFLTWIHAGPTVMAATSCSACANFVGVPSLDWTRQRIGHHATERAGGYKMEHLRGSWNTLVHPAGGEADEPLTENIIEQYRDGESARADAESGPSMVLEPVVVSPLFESQNGTRFCVTVMVPVVVGAVMSDVIRRAQVVVPSKFAMHPMVHGAKVVPMMSSWIDLLQDRYVDVCTGPVEENSSDSINGLDA